jgi:hypothetical protein
MMPLKSAARRLKESTVNATLDNAQRMDIVILLKDHAKAADQRVRQSRKGE